MFKPGVIRHESADFVVGVELYDDPKAIEQIFQRDLAASGYTATRLRIANQSKERFILTRANVSLIDGAGNRYAAVASTDVADALDRDFVPYAVLGFGSWSAKSVEDANAAMREDWADKELPDPVLFGGRGAQSGFVFFAPAAGKIEPDSVLELVFDDFPGEGKRTLSIRLSER
jgi:hypothetical protein